MHGREPIRAVALRTGGTFNKGNRPEQATSIMRK